MRLDVFLVEKNIFETRTKAQQSIIKDEIYIDGKLINKPSFNIDENTEHNIERKFTQDFVSLGGFKLAKALKDFQFNVKDFICCDIGASTGGFTDCLLKNGAKKVFAVDLNEGLLSNKLKQDCRVVSIIKNAKLLNVDDFNNKIDIITADLSFISATMILPVISNLLEKENYAIVLIKPQFEMDKRIKFKNGIIRDNKLLKESCNKVINCAMENNFEVLAITDAPIYKDKNHEFLLLLKKNK